MSRKELNWIKVGRGIMFAAMAYILLISPIFFMYPRHNEKEVLPPTIEEYFLTLSDSLTGDCYRMSQRFIIESVLPSREIHLNSEHTIVEVNIKGKWFAYDPLYKIFFNNKSALQVSIDVNRGYIPDYMEDYPYTQSFRNIKYYHSRYFVFLKFICPFYDSIMRWYFMVL